MMSKGPAIGVKIVPVLEKPFTVGYTGHCPRYTYRVNKCYGSQTHKLASKPYDAKLRIANYQSSPPCKNVIIQEHVENKTENEEECVILVEEEKQNDNSGEKVDGIEPANAFRESYALCDFSSPIRELPSSGIYGSRPPTSSTVDADISVIYHKHSGCIPAYTGHVPGYLFTYGQTFGHASTDAKRWIRRDWI